ncbi:MAG: signal recognition particle-docking protein FtsY [Oscillospiraceae bacterium]|nr:signal recognition particle-docking protein FtsY [Oscillospiraceae bacterium]
MKFFSKLQEGLKKTSKQIGALFASFTGADDDFYDELEETLIMADIGAESAISTVDMLREIVIKEGLRGADEIKSALAQILSERLAKADTTITLETTPSVILVIGVNGVGKTTTIGKLALRYVKQGKKVLLCAGDTFRAAAGEQLSVWADRAGAEIVRRDEGADPASVVFDAISAAKARGTDIIICDTAGRLHNKSNLMNELEKIYRIIKRELPDACMETLLVIDATTGQNGLIQARQFKEATDISGIVLTKLDGTAKGGIVIAIVDELNVPVKLVGVGEKPDDLIDFNGNEFAEAILS